MYEIQHLIILQIGRGFQEASEHIEAQAKLLDQKCPQQIANELNGVVLWFKTGCRPKELSFQSWSALSELACSFVERGDIDRNALLVFQ